MNTDVALLRLLQTQFGGKIYIRERNPAGWKPFASINWRNQHAYDLLHQVYPYLIVKRLQAQLAMKLIASRKDGSPRYDHTGTFPTLRVIKPEVLAWEEDIAQRIKDLNKRGIAA